MEKIRRIVVKLFLNKIWSLGYALPCFMCLPVYFNGIYEGGRRGVGIEKSGRTISLLVYLLLQLRDEVW